MLEFTAKYIDTLNIAAEDRLLTTKLVPNEISAENEKAGCIVGVATGAFRMDQSKRLNVFLSDANGHLGVIGEFNHACTIDPIGTAEFIRNRILENRATAVLKKELVTCP